MDENGRKLWFPCCIYAIEWLKRAQFNETAAIEFFYKMEGLPYGYHNFLYGFVDTLYDNWPSLLPKDFVPIVFSMLEKIDYNVTDIFFT